MNNEKPKDPNTGWADALAGWIDLFNGGQTNGKKPL